MYFFSTIVAIMVLVNVRRKDNGLRPLSWWLAIPLALFCAFTSAFAGELANRIGDRAFVVVTRWGQWNGVYVTWKSRSGIVLSNGDQFGQTAGRSLLGIELVLWFALMILIFVLAKFVLKTIAPLIYLKYARFLRQWAHPQPATKFK